MFNTEIKKMAQGLFPSYLFNWIACPMKFRQCLPMNKAKTSTSSNYQLGHFKIHATKFCDVECKDPPRKGFHKLQVTENANEEILHGCVFVYLTSLYDCIFYL